MKQLPDALIVVDMQDYFLNMFGGRRSWSLINAANKQITWALKHSVPVIVLEYSTADYDGDHSRTTWRIQQNLRFYKQKWYAMKNTDDGSDEVLEVMHGCEPRLGLVEKHRLVNLAGHKDTFKFHICGVNLDACVYETARGLVRQGHTVVAVDDATRNSWDNKTPKNTQGEWGILRKKHPKNCRVVKNAE